MQPDLATALAKHMCELDACSDPAPCPDHLTVAGVALKFIGNVAPAPIVLSLPPLSDAATADLKSRFMEQVLKYRYTVPPPTDDERVDAAYQRGLGAGQAERDQLRRLHEATEAALEQAEQYARDLQDNLAVVDSPATEGWKREWLIETATWWTSTVAEADARKLHARHGGKLVSRLVGPWETAEQTSCPTCSGPIRETVGMVCQTCGTDYAAGGVVDSAPEEADRG